MDLYKLNVAATILFGVFGFSSGFLWHLHKDATTEAPVDETTLASTSNSENKDTNDDSEIDPVKAEAGAIAGAVFGILVCVVFISVAGFMYLRRKRERDREYNRKTKVLKQSSQSAGVYMDTTTNNEMKQKTSSGPSSGRMVYTSLPRDPDIYEDDSEDELWSSA